MLKKRVAAGAAAVTLVLAGLGSAAGTPASADVPRSSAKCGPTRPVTALETVKVYLSEDGGPPKNKSELDKAVVLGLLQKGEKACSLVDGFGASYTVGGDCFPPGKNTFWQGIRFNGAFGWVAGSCTT
jgi:hypothetical protein